jgi:pimeloyl-ACP methyl ester carboxylesterase
MRRTAARIRWLGTAGAVAILTAAPMANADARVVSLPVTFHVKNVNRSQVACPSDGRPYLVRGRLVAPRRALGGGEVELYIHGLGADRLFDFRAVRGYDFSVAMAQQGRTSLVIDSLGYRPSDRPQGFALCLGSQADIVHQIVSDLRSGNYASGIAKSPLKFPHVILVGASFGGFIAQIEAYSFADLDGLVVMSWADQGFSTFAELTFSQTAALCASGLAGLPGSHPDSYAYFGQTANDYQHAFFYQADPAVVRTAFATRPRDPCGEEASFAQGILVDHLDIPLIHAPVLLIYGNQDALFPPPAPSQQASLYTGTPSLTTVTVAASGHYVPLERTRSAASLSLVRWLSREHL